MSWYKFGGNGSNKKNGGGSEMQQQQQEQQMLSKQDQVEQVVQAQLILGITQNCITNIKKLGNLYIEKAKKEEQEGHKINKNSNSIEIDEDDEKNGQDNDDENEKLFFQQMLTSQLLNTLRLAISDEDVVDNDSAHELSLLELGKFKEELLSGKYPKLLVDKLLPYVKMMQVTLQDYKKSFHVPGPKLDASTFNQETVSKGMEVFLESQHKAVNKTKQIKSNAQMIGKQHNNVLNNKDNKKLVKQYKNENIDSSTLSVDLLFDVNAKHLDFNIGDVNANKNEEDQVLDEIYGGRGFMKEESAKQNKKRAEKWKHEHNEHNEYNGHN